VLIFLVHSRYEFREIYTVLYNWTRNLLFGVIYLFLQFSFYEVETASEMTKTMLELVFYSHYSKYHN